MSKIDAKMLLRLFEPKMILNFKGIVLLLQEIWEHLQAKKTFEEILLTAIIFLVCPWLLLALAFLKYPYVF